ncbi:TfoX/Sxy family protein [Flavitalea flava]
MAFNEKMADRVREIIVLSEMKIEEKQIFSGLCFMVNDKMCIGIRKDSIMVRLDPKLSDEVLEKDGCSPMVHNNKVMRGFVFVGEENLTSKKKLEYWVNLALDFNKLAKSSRKNKKK